MQSDLQFGRYDDDARLYVINPADKTGDPLDNNAAIQELQAASRASILRACQNPANVVVKVTLPGPHLPQVRGYVTLARYLQGATPGQFERMLGMRSGALSSGCRVYYVNGAAITADNIGPRYFSSWSAGVSPRDLDVLSRRAGAPVEYHRDYPPAADPIPQFVLYRPVASFRSVPLAPTDRFSE
jgi:hypothetical protein